MSERRKKAQNKSRVIAIVAAVAIHVLILTVLLFNFTSKKTKVEAFDADKIDVVKATTIDESQIKQQQDQIKQKDKDKKRKEELEKKRLADLKKQAEQEKKRIAQLQEEQKKEQEKQKQEQQKTRELEAQRKEIALKKQQEKAQREKENREAEKKLAEKKKREAAELKKKKALAEKKKQEEAKKREQERKIAAEKKRKADEAAEQKRAAQQRFADQLAADEARERTTTLVGKHAALIRDSINAKRTIAPDFDSWLVAKLQIKLSSSGKVESVSVVQSSGNKRYDNDAEKAVLNASPLPIPTLEEDEDAHNTFRDMVLNVKMPGA